MRVAFDYEIFFYQSYGGISRYFANLIEELLKQGIDVGVFAPFHKNAFLINIPEVVYGKCVSSKDVKEKYYSLKIYNIFAGGLKTFKWKPDILHETYYKKYNISRLFFPSIITIHDMIPELYPHDVPSSGSIIQRKKRALNRASHVICVSENTKKDLINIYKTREDKISVIYHGCNCLNHSVGNENFFPNSRPYLLFVGKREGYKNFKFFLEAFSNSSKLKRDFDIYSFGSTPFSTEEKDFIYKLGFSTQQIRYLSGDDLLLSMLYRNARALVFPSLYEGFGMPTLEAMSNNCPVICSNAGSFPEIVGDAGVYFNPLSAASIVLSIEKVVYSDKIRAKMIEKGIERVKKYTWQKCAEETIKVYKKVLLSMNNNT